MRWRANRLLNVCEIWRPKVALRCVLSPDLGWRQWLSLHDIPTLWRGRTSITVITHFIRSVVIRTNGPLFTLPPLRGQAVSVVSRSPLQVGLAGTASTSFQEAWRNFCGQGARFYGTEKAHFTSFYVTDIQLARDKTMMDAGAY